MSEPIIYAECKECGGHEEIQDLKDAKNSNEIQEIQDLKDAKNWICAECTWDIIIERERREIYKHV